MKTELILKKENEIDWSKVNLLKHKEQDMIVLTDGEPRIKSHFSGMIVHIEENLSEITGWVVGDYVKYWYKEEFERINSDTTITFKV